VGEYPDLHQPTSLIVVPRYRRYRAGGIGGGQFGSVGRQYGTGPPSDGNAALTLAVGIGGGQFGSVGRQYGTGPPSENPIPWFEFFEDAIAEMVPSSIRPASTVVAIDFMAVFSFNVYPD
jgi:hypothetical protein